LSQRIQKLLTAGQPPIVMCAPQLRLAFRRFFETAFAELTVLSYAEIPSRVEVQNAGIIPSLE
jgi:flagellar biosynthesis component FlhA